MGGLILLLILSVVMAVTSFLAGALPLSMSLSQSQLRFVTSIGIGILVGTALIVIIPEGIEAVASTSVAAHSHSTRSHVLSPRDYSGVDVNADHAAGLYMRQPDLHPDTDLFVSTTPSTVRLAGREEAKDDEKGGEKAGEEKPDGEDSGTQPAEPGAGKGNDNHGEGEEKEEEEEEEASLPTFYIGFSLISGFVLMFLIDRLPRHAVGNTLGTPATRHISLDNLASSSVPGDDETDSFLGSLAPSPRHSRGLATTTGLVIHAAADGIAMGASATASDTKLGFIIFFALMIHKAPAAFGLTSLLLKQGLSKRAARGHLIVFSLAAPFGALATYLAVSLLGGGNMGSERGQWWTGMLLLFSGGTFLYVAMHAMQEDQSSQNHDHHGGLNGYADNSTSTQRKQAKPQMRDTLATVVGMLLPILTQFGHHH